ncbi:MAG: RluA family pseudouridine synthase, partial [Desulfitobacterium hafniense]|nr:RluA family pseudouridine synthase [Desulfitobacterium hafniense]
MSDDLWEYTLQPQDEGKTFQEILKRKFHFSTKLIQQLKKGEFVWVDGEFTFLSATGQSGQTLRIKLVAPEEATIPGEQLPLDILFEDDYFLAVNKPAGQVVHPTPRYPSGTIGNAVVGYLASKGDTRPFRPINRLDRNTSGVIVIAKNRFAHQQLAWQQERGQIKKVYLGVVSGVLSQDHGEIREPIRLVPGSFIQR